MDINKIENFLKENEKEIVKVTSSGVSFITLMGFGHYTFGAFGIHCSMPITSRLVGVGIVCGAAIGAKFISKNVKFLKMRRWVKLSPNQILLSAITGILLFKTLKGRFWAVLPSPVDHLGAYHHKLKGSIKASLGFLNLKSEIFG